jgi:hypothetical protein
VGADEEGVSRIVPKSGVSGLSREFLESGADRIKRELFGDKYEPQKMSAFRRVRRLLLYRV